MRGDANPEYTYLDEEGDSDAGTDSDTVLSCGDNRHDFQDLAHLSEVEKEQELFWAASHAKSRWRQLMRKPVRKVRRFFRKTINNSFTKGKGQGKRKGKRLSGKGISAYIADLNDDDYEDLFFGRGKGRGKGKSKNVRSSGKGKGRRTNPRGKDGHIMKCLGCQSENHLV